MSAATAPDPPTTGTEKRPDHSTDRRTTQSRTDGAETADKQQTTAAAAANPPTDRTEPADSDADGKNTQIKPTTPKQQMAATTAPDPPTAEPET